jgi:hypothetical protein
VNHQITTAYNDNDYIQIADNYWGISTFTRTGNVNVNQEGIYTLRYRTTDGSGNQSDEYVLRVFVRDLIPPHIELKGAPYVEVPVFGPYTDAGVTAFDAVSNVTITNNIATALNINVVGTYTITYTATDASGNTASVERIIRVVDKVAPVIKLLGRNPFEMTRLEHYADVDPGYVVTDNYYPASQITVTIDTSNLNTQVGGNYYVYYRAIDPSGNRSASVFRNVRVNFMTSVKEVASNNKLTVYPNPTNGVFTVQLPDNTEGPVLVYNILGSLIKQIEHARYQSKVELDLSTEKPGIYFVKVNVQGKEQTIKVQLVK